MLSRIVQQACDLVGARYGALGVFGTDHRLEQFVHHGMDEETVARIGGLPESAVPARRHGRRSRGRPARRPDQPTTALGGLPAGHRPRCRALLGVPILVRGEVYGSLYLTDPTAGDFSADDEKLVIAFAALAGNRDRQRPALRGCPPQPRLAARLRRDRPGAARRRGRGHAVEVVSRALDVAEADYGGLILPTDDGLLHVTVTAGVGADHFRGLVFDPVESPMGRAIIGRQSLLLRDMTVLANDRLRQRLQLRPG